MVGFTGDDILRLDERYATEGSHFTQGPSMWLRRSSASTLSLGLGGNPQVGEI